MTRPTNYTYQRQLQEAAAKRRLEIAKVLRQDPRTTNVELAKVLNVSRNTITLDRRAIMEQLQNATKNESELLRAEMVKTLNGLVAEVEKHRKDGKLSLQAIDRLLDIAKAIVELTGVRKPVSERLAVTHRAPIQFNTVIVPTTGSRGDYVKGPDGWKWVADAEVIKEPLVLGAGEEKH